MGDTPAVVKCFAADVVEAIDVLEERFGDLIAGRPNVSPDEFSL